MNFDIRQQYLTSEVNTAPPHKLQLMMLEGALRFASRARLHWDDNAEEVAECLSRSQEIVTELLASLNADIDRPLVRRVAAIYIFVQRALITASRHHDPKSLDEAISILELERETWQQVCKQLGTQPAAPIGNDLSYDAAPRSTGFTA